MCVYVYVCVYIYTWFLADTFEQVMCPKQVGYPPERLNGSGTGAMNILLTTRFVCNATIAAWEMYRIRPLNTGWLEILRPVGNISGEIYRVIHRTFVPAVAQNGIQRIEVGYKMEAEPGDVIAVRPDVVQFVDNVYYQRQPDWLTKRCNGGDRPAIDGSPSNITPCLAIYRKYSLRVIVN